MCGPPVKCELSRLKLTVKPRWLAPFQFLITTHNYAALRRESIILKQNQKVRPGPHLSEIWSMCDMVHINHVPTSSGFFLLHTNIPCPCPYPKCEEKRSTTSFYFPCKASTFGLLPLHMLLRFIYGTKFSYSLSFLNFKLFFFTLINHTQLLSVLNKI